MPCKLIISSSDAIVAVSQRVSETYAKVDIFVHAAGVNVAGAVDDYQEDAWDKVMNVNLKSAFFLTQALLPHFSTDSRGKILFITSISARHLDVCRYCFS